MMFQLHSYKLHMALAVLIALMTAGLATVGAQTYTITDLGTFSGNRSEATGINNYGQVVGESNDPAGWLHAFLWQAGSMVDLNSRIPSDSGWMLLRASAINDAGQIVGYGTINSQTHAFLLTPQ